MNVKELKKILNECSDDTSIVICNFVENNLYHSFKNITPSIIEKSDCYELRLNISINNENDDDFLDSMDELEILLDKREILLDELNDLDEEINGLWIVKN